MYISWIKTCKTGDQPYSDTYLYGEWSLFQPIRLLQTSKAKFYAGNFLYRIGPRTWSWRLKALPMLATIRQFSKFKTYFYFFAFRDIPNKLTKEFEQNHLKILWETTEMAKPQREASNSHENTREMLFPGMEPTVGKCQCENKISHCQSLFVKGSK